MKSQFRKMLSYPLFAALSLTFFSLLLSLSKGSTSVSHDQLLTVILWLRLPRLLSAFVAGALLALAGALIQVLLKNPLADPYVLGISGGASVCTLLLMLLGVNADFYLFGAWGGSLLTILLIFLLAQRHQFHPHTLLLSGIALACGFSACISFILLLTPDHTLHAMLFWLTGDLNAAYFPWIELGILGLGFTLCQSLAPGFNLLTRGEHQAKALGLATQNYRIALYLLSSLFTATAVTLVGCIGFIGLITPHLARLWVGYDHQRSLPICMLLGGSLLVVADTLARTLVPPQQLPVGIVMAMIGVPVFIWLLQR